MERASEKERADHGLPLCCPLCELAQTEHRASILLIPLHICWCSTQVQLLLSTSTHQLGRLDVALKCDSSSRPIHTTILTKDTCRSYLFTSLRICDDYNGNTWLILIDPVRVTCVDMHPTHPRYQRFKHHESSRTVNIEPEEIGRSQRSIN